MVDGWNTPSGDNVPYSILSMAPICPIFSSVQVQVSSILQLNLPSCLRTFNGGSCMYMYLLLVVSIILWWVMVPFIITPFDVPNIYFQYV